MVQMPAIKFHGVDTKSEGILIEGKVGFNGHPHLEHFKFLKAHCRVTPKMTIPAPSTFHFRQGRAMVSKQNYNAVLDAMAEFRSVHYGWANEYINRWTDDPRGTGGTPYMRWLKQLIDETIALMAA